MNVDHRAPRSHLHERARRVETEVEGLGHDALIVLAHAQKGYLSGFTTGVFIAPGGVMVMTRSSLPHVFITGGTDFEECQSALEPLGYRVEAYRSAQGQTLHTALCRMVGELGLSRLAVEGKYITVSQLEELRPKLAEVGAEIAVVGDIVDPLRQVKDPWEIEQIKQANAVNDLAFTHVLRCVREGVTEWELAATLEHQLRLHGRGSSRLAFQSIVVSGPRSSLPHGEVTARRLQRGDLVTMDFGATWNGYCSDVTRTFVVGKASDKQRCIYAAVLDAQRTAIATMQPGRCRRDSSEVAMSLIRERGFGEFMAHGAGGHGIGLEVHEGPSSRTDGVWEVGNVMTMEPGVYLPGWGGIRIEDNLVITANGPENITIIGKELLEI